MVPNLAIDSTHNPIRNRPEAVARKFEWFIIQLTLPIDALLASFKLEPKTYQVGRLRLKDMQVFSHVTLQPLIRCVGRITSFDSTFPSQTEFEYYALPQKICTHKSWLQKARTDRPKIIARACLYYRYKKIWYNTARPRCATCTS